MRVDGKIIAEGIKETLRRVVADFPTPPTLAVVIVGSDEVTERFVRMKKKFADDIGVVILEQHFPATTTTDTLCICVKELNSDASIQGIVVQLPLPAHIETSVVLDAISVSKDVDMLSHEAMARFRMGTSPILPPVAGAVQAILEDQNIIVEGIPVLVVGHGKLVGAPVALLMRHAGANVTVIDQPTPDLVTHVRDAEIVISGVGIPALITPSMVRDGAVLVDAGTSESEGKLAGDIDPRCESLSRLFTPVPGGVGPITVAMLFKNLCILAKQQV